MPSTWLAPPAVLENVGSVEKTLSSRILPHRVQHLFVRGWDEVGRGRGQARPRDRAAGRRRRGIMPSSRGFGVGDWDGVNEGRT